MGDDTASLDSSLLRRAREGSSSALRRLVGGLLPSLERWAHGRLPRWARARLDTGDLVQEALIALLPRVRQLEFARRHALKGYLRESIRNRIRDEVRRAGKVEVDTDTSVEPPSLEESPLETTLKRDSERLYRTALARLAKSDQELIVGRIELGYSYEQLALASGRPTAGSARLAVRRALLRLAESVDREPV